MSIQPLSPVPDHSSGLPTHQALSLPTIHLLPLYPKFSSPSSLHTSFFLILSISPLQKHLPWKPYRMWPSSMTLLLISHFLHVMDHSAYLPWLYILLVFYLFIILWALPQMCHGSPWILGFDLSLTAPAWRCLIYGHTPPPANRLYRWIYMNKW